MSGGDSGGNARRSPSFPARPGASDPALSLSPSDLFSQQLELMLSKSASNRSAASPPRSGDKLGQRQNGIGSASEGRHPSRTGVGAASEAGPMVRPLLSSWPRTAQPPLSTAAGSPIWGQRGEVRSSAAGSELLTAATKSSVGLADSKGWPSTAAQREETDSIAVPPPPKPRPPRSLFALLNGESSGEDNDDEPWPAFGKAKAVATAKTTSAVTIPRPSPLVAEAKSGTGIAARGNRDARGGEGDDDGFASSPGPSSDGGWPETKRCPPPNLQRAPPSNGKVVVSATGGSTNGGSDRGYGNKGKGKASPSPRRDRTLGAVNGGGGDEGVNGRQRTSSGDDWMSDADDRGPKDPRPGARNGPSTTVAARAGVKRGRASTSVVRSLDGRGSEGSSSGADGRGGKTGRSERYPAPVPRGPRSSSLSLSPSRFPAFDSDYDSDEDSESASALGATGRKGRGKKASSSSPRRTASSARGRGGDDRGRKRGHEEFLNERIQAMRVASDGEGEGPSGRIAHGGGGSSGRGRRGRVGGNVVDPMDADEQVKSGHRRDLELFQGGGEEEDYGDVDDDDLKPTIENPPWLGPLEAYNLGDGGSINPSINRYLQGYQRDGVAWLYSKYKAGEGGILGDDMGLGKTVQAITLLSAALHKTGAGRDREELRRRRKAGLPACAEGLPWLIIAPASVVRVWMDHLSTWGYFSAFQLESGKQMDDLMSALDAGRLEVVATSYDLLRICLAQLKKARFEGVVFDEYHTIKSSSAMVSQAACELKTKRVFGLTGTLIQNDLKELWFLLHLIDPASVGEKSRFTEHFSEPIKRARAMNASPADRRLGEKRLKELTKIRSNIMIRRTKEEELSDVLKGKSDTVVFCDLSQVQRDLYRNTLSLPELQLLKRAGDKCDCGRKNTTRARCCYKLPFALDARGRETEEIDSRAVLFSKFHKTGEACPKCPFCCQLAAVSKLQKIANHPCLLQENLLDPEVMRKHQRTFAQVAFTDRAKEAMGGLVRSQKFMTTHKTDVCGKMASLEVLLEKFYSTRDKVLVFSWSTAMLDVLESFVTSKGYTYRRLDGGTSAKERQARIMEFNSDRHSVFVFLVSTRAGGQGLNLYTASRVVLYDVNWNPALELQAQDRAYRIGQKNKVAVFRLISKGTIEEVCYMRQIYKLQITSAAMGDLARGGRRQFNAIQGAKGQEGELFGIQNLLNFSDDSLLKALRLKYAAAAQASGVAGVVPGDEDRTESSNASDPATPTAAAVVAAGQKLPSSLETANGADLMQAVHEVVVHVKEAAGRAKEVDGRANEEIQPGEGDETSADAELAGLLGVLGLDAYTHDQLVAKDEGEEELSDEASAAEVALPRLPHGGARNALEQTMNPRGLMTHRRIAAASPTQGRRTKGNGSGGGGGGRARASNGSRQNDGGSVANRTGRAPRARPGTISPLPLELVSRGRASERRNPSFTGIMSSARRPTSAVIVEFEDSEEVQDNRPLAAETAQSAGAQPQEPAKKRRNLDWVRGKREAPAGADSSGNGGRGESGGRFKLFMPEYGAGGSGGQGGGDGGDATS